MSTLNCKNVRTVPNCCYVSTGFNLVSTPDAVLPLLTYKYRIPRDSSHGRQLIRGDMTTVCVWAPGLIETFAAAQNTCRGELYISSYFSNCFHVATNGLVQN